MFVLEITPEWMPPVIFSSLFTGVFLFVGMISFANRNDDRDGMSVLLAIVSVVLISGSGILTIYNHVNPNLKTVDNPYAVSEEQRVKLELDQDTLEEKIVEALDVDKVELVDYDSALTKSRAGNMVDFTAVEEGTLVEGKFYFTETTLEILVSGEADIMEHVSIATE